MALSSKAVHGLNLRPENVISCLAGQSYGQIVFCNLLSAWPGVSMLVSSHGLTSQSRSLVEETCIPKHVDAKAQAR